MVGGKMNPNNYASLEARQLIEEHKEFRDGSRNSKRRRLFL
jgi:hypothetical protein